MLRVHSSSGKALLTRQEPGLWQHPALEGRGQLSGAATDGDTGDVGFGFCTSAGVHVHLDGRGVLDRRGLWRKLKLSMCSL